jgi:predicted metal-binding protein
MRNKEGAFRQYADSEVELVGYTTCDGCPGGNVEYTGEEMVKNGAQVIHLATGLLVGYPPCPYIHTFKTFLEKRYGVKVVVGTHPIPKKYLDMHTSLGTYDRKAPEDAEWQPLLAPTMTDEATRKAYD